MVNSLSKRETNWDHNIRFAWFLCYDFGDKVRDYPVVGRLCCLIESYWEIDPRNISFRAC